MRYALNHCTCEATDVPARGYRFTGKYVDKDETHSVFVTEAGLEAYKAGRHIQDACPELSADDREFLISGVSPAGWDALFRDDE